ncbi:MAG: glycosyltransferase family 2 protein [Flavobacterium sp.]|nr:glycosyltransferase family 2 protein [Flavobacterium sp.]
MKLSIVIPAYNESLSLPETIKEFYTELCANHISHEILVVNDNSKDNTIEVLENLKTKFPTLVYITNNPPYNGFGYAVRKGLENFSGDCVAVVMADLSDSPKDLLTYYNTFITQKVDCVFGSRFIKGSKVINYPRNKLYINRFVNTCINWVFRLKYNDCTNAFKLYSKQTIEGIKPFMSPHFNLTVELPLKAVVRGYTYTVVPNSWQNRKHGTSNLKIREMGSRYFFIILYCLIEKYFSRGDFKKKWD